MSLNVKPSTAFVTFALLIAILSSACGAPPPIVVQPEGQQPAPANTPAEEIPELLEDIADEPIEDVEPTSTPVPGSDAISVDPAQVESIVNLASDGMFFTF